MHGCCKITCFPSTAPIMLGKFQRWDNFSEISNRSSTVLRVFRYASCISWMIAFAAVEITLEIFHLLIQNCYSKDRNDSPLAMYLKVTLFIWSFTFSHDSVSFYKAWVESFNQELKIETIHSNKLFERFSIV